MRVRLSTTSLYIWRRTDLLVSKASLPRAARARALRAFAQTALSDVQAESRDVQAALVIRGGRCFATAATVDAAAYWPGEPHHYFNAVRDDGWKPNCVLSMTRSSFFETAAAGRRIHRGRQFRLRPDSLVTSGGMDGRLRSTLGAAPPFCPSSRNNPSVLQRRSAFEASRASASFVPLSSPANPDATVQRPGADHEAD
jgi:hypothetical protein